MKIAIIRLSALGDIVHSLTVLPFIKKHLPSSHITWVTDSAFKELARHNPHIDQVLDIDLKSLKKDFSIKKLRAIKERLKKEYDVVFDMQGLIKSALIGTYLSKKRVGREIGCVKESLAALFYTDRVVVPCEKNVVDRNMQLISKYLGFDYSHTDILNKEPLLFFDKSKNYSHIDALLDRTNILYVPSSSVKNKNYPPKKYVEVIKSLPANSLLLWGNEEEKRVAETIAKECNAKILPKLSLNDLKYLISKTDLVIGGDTGPVHMAWGLNKKSVVLFGYTTPNLMFQTPKNRAISAKEVDLCNWDKKDGSIKEIEPGKIVEAAKKLLESE